MSQDKRSVHGGERMHRRRFVELGFMAIGGWTLAGLPAAGFDGTRLTTKALINVHLFGGPSHIDIFDLKPHASAEFRGEFRPISTNVVGIEICQHLPRLAQLADKYTIIRSLVGSSGEHSNLQTHTGYGLSGATGVSDRPAMGSVVAKTFGDGREGAPCFISFNGGNPGYLGPTYRPFDPLGGNLKLNRDLSAGRLEDRQELLTSLDRFRRESDASGQMEALDSLTERAIGVITSGRLANALDRKKVDDRDDERYGRDGSDFLIARRLVESGVRVVTFNWGGWDTHAASFASLKRQLPRLDQALSALLEDLAERGLDQDVTVIVWGEFGRTPRINSGAGRDHWTPVSSALVAGGGMKTGQVIGATTRYAEDVKDRPVHFGEVFATLYHNLGIDVRTAQLRDAAGRPHFLVERGEVIRELVK